MESTTKRIKKLLDNMYDVASVPDGFNYWFNKLLGYCLGMFDYDGLPDSLPKRQIEINLLLTGHCVVFRDRGELVTCGTTLYDYDKYYDPTKAVFAQPKLFSKPLYLAGDAQNAVVVYNNDLQNNVLYFPTDSGLLTFISRYARRLADIESTESIYAVNMRLVSFPVGGDDSIIASIKKFFANLTIGKREVIADNSIIQQFRTVDVVKNATGDKLNDIIQARDKVLEQFFRDIGVKFFADNKRAQMTDEEVESNDQMLIISPDEMLRKRKEGIEKVNAFFGTNITVKLNDKFNREVIQTRKETNENEAV